MIDDLVELREGWTWPRADQRCWKYMKDHSYIPDMVADFVSEDQRGVIVQAGGNCGFYPRRYAELFDTVYTFEPDWLNFYCLSANVPYSNVVKIQGCVGNQPQLVNLSTHSVNCGKNFVNGTGHYPVHLIDNLALDRCDAIQLDIEGYEYFALLGAEATIKRFCPVIVIEVWPQLDNRFGKHLNARTHQWLLDRGYQNTCVIDNSDYVYQHV
jgi:FkbM family methyltransferase